MSVHLLAVRPGRRRLPRRPAIRRRLDSPAVSVSFEITLPDGSRHSDAMELIDAIHHLVEQVEGAHVSMAGGPVLGGAATRTLTTVVPDGEVWVDVDARHVRLGPTPVAFTKVEYDLLLFLVDHPRQVFTRRQLLQRVWGHAHAGERTVDVHIRRLRAKLGDELVTTVRSVGYRLADEARVRVIRHHPSGRKLA